MQKYLCIPALQICDFNKQDKKQKTKKTQRIEKLP